MNVVALRAVACENQALTITCEGSAVIEIINAHYGRLDMLTCQNNIATPGICLFNATREVVYDRSVRMSQCRFNTTTSNDFFSKTLF